LRMGVQHHGGTGRFQLGRLRRSLPARGGRRGVLGHCARVLDAIEALPQRRVFFFQGAETRNNRVLIVRSCYCADSLERENDNCYANNATRFHFIPHQIAWGVSDRCPALQRQAPNNSGQIFRTARANSVTVASVLIPLDLCWRYSDNERYFLRFELPANHWARNHLRGASDSGVSNERPEQRVAWISGAYLWVLTCRTWVHR
jgi:hypothetical protein